MELIELQKCISLFFKEMFMDISAMANSKVLSVVNT